MLSRPSYTEGAASDVYAITVDMPSRKSNDILKGQLEDEELKKIIDCFESMDKDENFANYTSRGYLMNQGISYRYSPESEEEEAQLVVPAQERERILQEYHDAPTAGYYGVENTYKKVASRYYFREDTIPKWVELFALDEATAENWAKILIEEVLLRYSLPRKLIGDNEPKFVSAAMQLTCDLLEITQDLIPVYHPQANPSEHKNRDLKPRLAILVEEEQSAREDKLPLIRFAMNTFTPLGTRMPTYTLEDN
ncbi:transposon Tf2-9 polyprotein [Trichonephila clavipes]|nr:transposon Tf2-9 polyprotein [Trichonephila clavipes]